MENIAFDYNVSKSHISDAIKWVEEILRNDKTFSLPTKQEIAKRDAAYGVIIVDSTECETERPQKGG